MGWIIEPQLSLDGGDSGIILICPGAVGCTAAQGLCFDLRFIPPTT